MLCKAHLTSHSKMSGSRWVITPSWLSGSLRPFLYSSSLSSCRLFLVSSASVRSIPSHEPIPSNKSVYICVCVYFSPYILRSTLTDIHVIFLFKMSSFVKSIFVSFKSSSKLKLVLYDSRYNILGLHGLSLDFLKMLFHPCNTLYITHERSDTRQIFLFI